VRARTPSAASPRRRVHLYSVPVTTMPSLWPREHGASMQLAFPLLSACTLGEGALASLALTLAAVLAFLAHEPLLLLAGGRGVRKRELARGPALRRLLLLALLACSAAAVSLVLAPSSARPLVLLPAALGAVAFGIALRGKERNAVAEVFVAMTLSTLAIPVAVFGGVPLLAAASLTAIWAIGFAVATVAARALVVQKKDAGRGLRLALVVAALTAVALLVAVSLELLKLRLAAAPLPLVVTALVLAVFPPAPKRMMAVGFGMTGASLVTLALAVSALYATN